jgi:16S rRNA (adenine1518-N6/adenine1519-N6)-dimethyltransferase
MSYELPPLRDVVKRFDLNTQKRLGQHFLLDLNLTARIARAAGNLRTCTVIEVGPGPGGLTRALLDNGAKLVIAIERDSRCVKAIEELAIHYNGRLKVINANALKVEYASLCQGPKKIVANLPYNVATPLLIDWLKNINQFESLTLMFQKEVADRLTASPGNKTYGRLSVLAQWLCHASHEFNISCTAFTPPPKVESTVVTLTPREKPLASADWKNLEKVTAAAFGQRRKMLRASLKSLNVDLESLSIDPTARAETLSVDQFCAIARSIGDF